MTRLMRIERLIYQRNNTAYKSHVERLVVVERQRLLALTWYNLGFMHGKLSEYAKAEHYLRRSLEAEDTHTYERA